MSIEEVSNIIGKIADGLEERCISYMASHSDTIVTIISEQMIRGRGGDDEYLTPTYDDDPFFEEEGYWQGRYAAYKAWKQTIAVYPPNWLHFDPRPPEVPNLWIDGTFHGEIKAYRQDNSLFTDPGNGNGPAIVEKYENYHHDILNLGPRGIAYFNYEYLEPEIGRFFQECGYK